MIQFRDVSVCYNLGARRPANALEDVTLDVQAGEWVFFVGPSGAGKSTLLKLAYAGVLATRGRVFVDGQDVTQPSPQEVPKLRRKVGVVFQDFQLLSQKTVWENVAFALQVIGAPQKRLVRDVPRALETVGLETKGQARPHELSGGEQQRVAIARAIVNNPKILVADEPTGNLDPRTADDIAEVLARINERGTTILMATHDRPLVDRLKKRVVRITNHRVVSDEAVGYYHPEDDAAPPFFASNFAPQDDDDALALAAALEDEDAALQNASRVLATPQTPRPRAASSIVAPQNAASTRSAPSHAAPLQSASTYAPQSTPQNGASANVSSNSPPANAPQNGAPHAASTRDDASTHSAQMPSATPQNVASQSATETNATAPNTMSASVAARSAAPPTATPRNAQFPQNVPQNSAPHVAASAASTRDNATTFAPPSNGARADALRANAISGDQAHGDQANNDATHGDATCAGAASTRDNATPINDATLFNDATHANDEFHGATQNADDSSASHALRGGVVSPHFIGANPSDHSPLVRLARDSQAPIGSPENPIVQLDSGATAPPL